MSNETKPLQPKITTKAAKRLLDDCITSFRLRFPLYRYNLYSNIDEVVDFYEECWDDLGLKDPFPLKPKKVSKEPSAPDPQT